MDTKLEYMDFYYRTGLYASKAYRFCNNCEPWKYIFRTNVHITIIALPI